MTGRCVGMRAITVVLLAMAEAAGAQLPETASFDALLRANVKSGHVDYAGFQDNPGLKAYLAELAKPANLDSKTEQLAHNINAYNAFAIQGILDGLSPSSFIGRQRYFKLQEWPLAGKRISLHDLEHVVLRPMGEPRMHFAIICASKSCPFLRSEVYTAAKLDAQLDDQARQFVNDPSRTASTRRRRPRTCPRSSSGSTRTSGARAPCRSTSPDSSPMPRSPACSEAMDSASNGCRTTGVSTARLRAASPGAVLCSFQRP